MGRGPRVGLQRADSGPSPAFCVLFHNLAYVNQRKLAAARARQQAEAAAKEAEQGPSAVAEFRAWVWRFADDPASSHGVRREQHRRCLGQWAALLA